MHKQILQKFPMNTLVLLAQYSCAHIIVTPAGGGNNSTAFEGEPSQCQSLIKHHMPS